MQFDIKSLKVVTSLLLLISPTSASTQDNDALLLHTTQVLVVVAQPLTRQGSNIRVADVLRNMHFVHDKDGSGDVDLDDVVLKFQLERADRNSSSFSYWARHNLNGDNVVTSDEIRQVYLAEARRSRLNFSTGELSEIDDLDIETRVQARVESAANELGDTNGDGIFTIQEIMAKAASEYPLNRETIEQGLIEASAPYSNPILINRIYDQDGNGGVNLDEFINPFLALISQFDIDKDEKLSVEEIAPLIELEESQREAFEALPNMSWVP